jgi:hypothetical protein
MRWPILFRKGRAREAFATAYAAYHDAKSRRDSRAKHERLMPLKAARTAQLRAELGRR